MPHPRVGQIKTHRVISLTRTFDENKDVGRVFF